MKKENITKEYTFTYLSAGDRTISIAQPESENLLLNLYGLSRSEENGFKRKYGYSNNDFKMNVYTENGNMVIKLSVKNPNTPRSGHKPGIPGKFIKRPLINWIKLAINKEIYHAGINECRLETTEPVEEDGWQLKSIKFL